MTEYKKVSTPDGYADEASSMERWKSRILAKLLREGMDVDLDTAEYFLTDEDRQVLAASGGPAELVARIRAQSNQPTEMEMQETTDTIMDAKSRPGDFARGLNELHRGLDEFQELDELRWSCDYRKQEIIGHGGQGIVFKTQCVNERKLTKALKVFSPRPYKGVDSYYEDMDRMADVASLVYHTQVDNLVSIEDFTYRKGLFMMIMRWVDGYDLATLLKPRLLDKVHGCLNQKHRKHLTNVVVAKGMSQSRLTPGVAVYIAERCLQALGALHTQGIVHGDIKPSNIMLDRYGCIRLIDIGSAFELSVPPHRHTWTPLYAPPEIFEGGQWTPQSDLASLGYVLIELLSGQPAVASPHIGSESTREIGTGWNQHLLDEKRRLPERLNDLIPGKTQESDRLMALLRRLIDPDPAGRFKNAVSALDGPDGTFLFLQELAIGRLATNFASKIQLWIADVEAAQHAHSH